VSSRFRVSPFEDVERASQNDQRLFRRLGTVREPPAHKSSGVRIRVFRIIRSLITVLLVDIGRQACGYRLVHSQPHTPSEILKLERPGDDRAPSLRGRICWKGIYKYSVVTPVDVARRVGPRSELPDRAA
jgi:hypothetical protein